MRLRHLLYCLFFLFTFQTCLNGQTRFIWPTGEELTYNVSWSFINLGTVKLKVLGKTEIDGKQVNRVKFTIQSNPMLFWLQNESVYESFIDDSLRTIRFITDEYVDGVAYKAVYNFNYTDSLVNINLLENTDSTKSIDRVIEMHDRLIDGIALIYDTREQVNRKNHYSRTTFFEDNTGDVELIATGRTEPVEIDTLDQPIESWLLEGNIHIKGIAGVTGPYKGWFSADETRVPVFAELKVFIGNVKVELEDWEKWQPPMLN